MKVRFDFVTNSSSASFLLVFRAIGKSEKEVRTHLAFLSKMQQNPEDFQLESLPEDIFILTAHTTMYNDDRDIPSYMKLMEECAKDPMTDFKFIKFMVKDEG